MTTDPTEAASPTNLALLVMAGLPKPQHIFTEPHPTLSILNILVKTASNLQEAIKLIETGFQLVDTMEGIKIYRKRK